jgi:hypothetical protein
LEEEPAAKTVTPVMYLLTQINVNLKGFEFERSGKEWDKDSTSRQSWSFVMAKKKTRNQI